jgi:hypothetical protein
MAHLDAADAHHDRATTLAALRADTKLKLPDCLSCWRPEQTGGAVATFDDRLAAAARGRGLGLSGR